MTGCKLNEIYSEFGAISLKNFNNFNLSGLNKLNNLYCTLACTIFFIVIFFKGVLNIE